MPLNIMNYAKVRDVKDISRGTNRSAGIDFYVPNDFETVYLNPGERTIVPSGIHLEVPHGHALIAFNKSGVATKTGLDLLACVVDEDYQGEILISVVNTSNKEVVKIEAGIKLTQFVLIAVNYATPKAAEFDKLYQNKVSERGAGGFGSTGLT